MKKWLFLFSFLLLFLSITPLKVTANNQVKITHTKAVKEHCLTVDTAKVKNLDCIVFDTIRLVGTGKKYKKKQVYFTDHECTVVELNKKKNTNRFGWNTVIKFLEKVIKVL